MHRMKSLSASCARTVASLALGLAGTTITAFAAQSATGGHASPALAVADSLDATAGPEPASQATALPSPPQSPADDYARFGKLITKGFSMPIPGPAAYIDPDPGGFRSRLADNGWGYWGFSLNTLTYDARNHGRTYGGSQVYSGQKATLSSQNFLFVTYDLQRHGIENGQLSAALVNIYANWEPAGPNTTRIGQFQFYRTFKQGKVELMLGNLTSSFMYVGTHVGGNLASGTFGVSASVPSQVGMSTSFLARPGANIRINLGGGFYDMFGYHRSINPDGHPAEKHANPTGLSLAGDHVGNLWVNEFGFRRKASPEQRDVWVRGGYIRNYSDYQSRRVPGTRQDDNHAAYLLADGQLRSLATSAGQASRGLYAGFSYMYAPADINTFTEYNELRLYAKGPFNARPNDMLSLVVSRNVFSEYAIRNARSAGLPTEYASTALSLSYSGSILRGVTLTGGVSYIDHPRPVSTYDLQRSGLNLQTAVHVFF
jgi:porin